MTPFLMAKRMWSTNDDENLERATKYSTENTKSRGPGKYSTFNIVLIQLVKKEMLEETSFVNVSCCQHL